MAEKKDILLQVRADMSDAIKQIGDLNTKIAGLKAAESELKVALRDANENGVDAQGRSVQQLAQEIAANTETQKALRKEITEVSRGVQNTIISQNTYRDTLKGLAAQLSVEKDKLRQVKIEGGVLTDEYLRQQKVVNDLNTKVSTLEQAYGVYARNVGNYKSGVQELNEQLRQHLTRLNGLQQGTKEWDAEAQAVRKVTGELEDLNREQAKQDKEQQGFFQKAKAGWTAMVGWVAAVVAAVVGLIKAVGRALKTNIEFAQQQKNLQTILGVTNEEMQAMTEHAKELGRSTEYTASQVTELQIALAKLGFGAQQIKEMSASVLALATDLDAGLGESADMVGATLRQFGLQATDTARVVDVLVKGANESALSFDYYRTALSQVAPVANAMGFDLEGVVAILGSLANVGMDASMAATSARNILLKLADSSSELAQSLNQPVKDIPTLVAGLKELQGRGINVAEAMELTDKRSVAAFTSLMKNADAIDELNGKLQDLDGYAIGIREERLQTTAGAIKMLQSAWEGFTLAVLNSEGALSRFFRGLADDINILTDKIDPEGKARRDFEDLVQNYADGYNEIAKVAAEKGIDVAHALQTMFDTETQSMQASANEQGRIIQSMNHQLAATDNKRERKRLEQIKANAEAELATIRNNYQALKKAYEQIQAERDKASGTTDAGGGGSVGGAMPDEEKKKASQAEIRQLDNAKKLSDALLAQQKQYEYDSTKSAAENAELKWQHEQEWAQRNKEAQDSYEREKLRIQNQYDQITTDEYNNGLKTLDVQRDTFYKEQEQKAVEHYTKVTEAVTKAIAGGDIKAQIKDVESKYKEMYAGLNAMVAAGKMSAEEASYYKIGLKQKETEEIKKLQKQQTENEQKELEAQAKARADKLATDLKLAWQNAEQQYQIRRQYLERELALYKDNAAKRAELEQQLAALESEHLQQKIDRMTEYTEQVVEMFSSISTIATNTSNARVQQVEQANEKEKQALDKRLKNGLISQKQYDDKVAKMDAELAEKKAEETRKQAAREKALSAFQIVLNTAAAIMKIWAEVPKMDFGVSTAALTAVAAATGALQLGAVLSEPLPKARRGGLVQGAKHEQGGVLVETEGEERIIAANPSKAFPELLNLISYIGKKGDAVTTQGTRTASSGDEQRRTRSVERLADAVERQGERTEFDSVKQVNERVEQTRSVERLRELLNEVIRPSAGATTTFDRVEMLRPLATVPQTGFAERQYGQMLQQTENNNVTRIEIDYDKLGEVVGQKVGEEIKNLQVWLSLTELRDAQDNVVHLDELARQ